MVSSMKLKKLEELLQHVEGFGNPKIKLEQYVTMPHIASRMLHTIQFNFGDLEGKMVADLGCGCGTLGIGAALLGAQVCVGFEIDNDALEICKMNCAEYDLNNMDIVQCDVTTSIPERFHNMFDCVIMNPPFGTKNKGVDLEFLNRALNLSNSTVYSLHKTSTRNHVLKAAQSLGASAKVVAELRYNLPATYKFHKKQSVDIEVDFIQFTKQFSDRTPA